MDEGLIFWLVIFAIAVLQGIGQRKKKPGQKGPGSSRPSPDAGGRTTATRVGDSQGREDMESSEGLVPSDVWEEILGLARGEPSKRRGGDKPTPQLERGTDSGSEFDLEPAPEVVPAKPPVPAPAPEPRAKSVPSVRTQGKSVSTDLGPPADPILSATRSSSRRTSVGRGRGISSDLFGDGSLEDLRKAVILREVLGPPLGLREE